MLNLKHQKVLEEYPAAASPIAATTKTKPRVILVFII